MAIEASQLAAQVSWHDKVKHLATFDETSFRDRVIRPLYHRFGLKFIRDTCGPDEEGKDCIFTSVNTFGDVEIYVVQTKRGAISMASDPSKNVATLLAQVRTAATTEVILETPQCRRVPEHVHVCASGKVSNRAREHIQKNSPTPTVRVLGSAELIEKIDERYPEFWFGIDANRFPYLRALQESIAASQDAIVISDLEGAALSPSVVSDDGYVPLYVSKLVRRVSTTRKQAKLIPDIEDLAVDRILPSRERALLLLGEGGSGKTVAIRRIAHRQAERLMNGEGDAMLPVLLKAQVIADSGTRLSETAELMARRCAGAESSVIGADDLQDGKVVILVDGLDEVQEDQRSVILSRIRDFMSDFPKCTLIVASREYRSILGHPLLYGFTHLRMLPIEVKQAEKLIQLAAERRHVDPTLAKEMLRRLEDVHGLALSPMLVTAFLASSDFTKQDVPPNIAEIFKKYTELMLGRWDQKKGLRQQYQAQAKDFLLRSLAFEMHKSHRTEVDLAECERHFAALLEERDLDIDVETMLNEIVYRSGLLNVDSTSSAVSFRHHLVQEFFAGRGVPSADFFGQRLADEWWRVPLVFYFGDNPDSYDELHDLLSGETYPSPTQDFEAAVAIGLATQACYLAKTSDRVEALRWVVERLATTMYDYAAKVQEDTHQTRPVTAFMVSYLLGRDAVGCRVMQRLIKEPPSEDEQQLFGDALQDQATFWILTGLLEAGCLEEAVEGIREFRPDDKRLLLALHLGLAFYLHVRDPLEDERKLLLEAATELAAKVSNERHELVSEIRGIILEMRRGQLEVVDENGDEQEVATDDVSGGVDEAGSAAI